MCVVSIKVDMAQRWRYAAGMRALLSIAAVLLVSGVGLATPEPWKLDAGHSRVGFKVSHLVVSEVSGQFREFEKSEVQLDEQDLTKSSARIELRANSIDTGDSKRDEHLRGPDFFDAKKYPLISFASKSITRGADGAYRVLGDLTIRDVKKPLTLDAKVSEAVKSPKGSTVRAVKLSGAIKRSDYGIKWNKTLDTGGAVVGDEVKLEFQLELVK